MTDRKAQVAATAHNRTSNDNAVRLDAYPGESHQQVVAKAAAGGILGNAKTMATFAKPTLGAMALTLAESG